MTFYLFFHFYGGGGGGGDWAGPLGLPWTRAWFWYIFKICFTYLIFLENICLYNKLLIYDNDIIYFHGMF